jgi:hypothetical protein
MATYTKSKLSGSTDGKPILITATATAGTLVHTAVTGTTNYDEIWLWLVNNGSSDLLATIEYGDAVTSSNIMYSVIARDGLKCVLPGTVLHNGATVKVFAATGSLISAVGFVNNIVA